MQNQNQWYLQKWKNRRSEHKKTMIQETVDWMWHNNMKMLSHYIST
jgi:hypothetical protein